MLIKQNLYYIYAIKYLCAIIKQAHMDLPTILSQRLTKEQISAICYQNLSPEQMDELFAPVLDPDYKVSYNAMWLWTHLVRNKPIKNWLKRHYDTLVTLLLAEVHSGKRRLLLSLINHISPVDNPRSELLDYCIERVNSSDDIAVRAFCINQLTILVRQYPDLIGEIEYALELLENGEIQPAIAASRRKLIKQIQQKLNS